MTRRAKIFVATYAIIAILASLSILKYIVDNLERQFITIMDKNTLIFQDKVVKINDVLELEGKKANLLINLDDFHERFDADEQADMLNYLSYDETRDIFHMDNIQNSDFDLSKISNVTGNGNLDFLRDEDSVKVLELYLTLYMNEEFKWLNDRLEASEWVYYTSLNQLASIRTKSGEFVTSDEFQFMDEMLEMSFITDGYKENLENRELVYWSPPYVDLAGKGMMVTASFPVDYIGEYIGSISIDFISENLSKILSGKYSTFIVGEDGVVFATNIENLNLSSELNTVDGLSLGLTYDEIRDIEYNKIVKIKGRRVIAKKLVGSPYILYQVYPKKMYIIDLLIDFFPVAIIFIFFGVTTIMLRRVRDSETKLKETLSVLELKQEELDYISKYDPLTNIYNRRGLYSEIKKMEEDGELIGSSLILFDIDHFKLVNDTYGHDVGDDVLTEICLVVRNYIGENEVFARYGGEEFIIISKETDLLKTCQIAEKVRVGVESHSFKTIESLTISLGVSTFRSKDTTETWVANADASLYKAKNGGRNKVYYYENYDFICFTDSKQ